VLKFSTVIIFLSLIQVFVPAIVLWYLGFTDRYEFIFAGSIDQVITLIVVFIFLRCNKNLLNEYNFRLTSFINYSVFFSVLFVLFYLLAILYNTIGNFKDLLSGVTREDLLMSGTNYFNLIFSNLFFIVLGIALAINVKTSRVYLILALCLPYVLFQLSRSSLEIVAFVTLTTLYFTNRKLNYSHYKLIFIGLLLLSLITIMQGRSNSLIEGFSRVIYSYFEYKTASFFLVDRVLEFPLSLDKYLFPFFGFPSEKILSLFSYVEHPISIGDSTFVSDLIYINDFNTHSNVLYSWWSWFFLAYGWFGILFIKPIYIYVTLLITRRLKVTFLYLISYFVFWQSYRHLLLNSSSMYTLIGVIFLDIVIFISAKNKDVQANSN
jgi:hypothetical protein